jgi:hypothetical protein
MKEAAMIQIAVGRARAPLSLDWDLACGHQARAGVPMSDTAKYGRTEREWQERDQAGWDFLKAKAAGRRGDAAHDPTVSYSDANEELATRTGQPAFDFGQQAGRAAIGYLACLPATDIRPGPLPRGGRCRAGLLQPRP